MWATYLKNVRSIKLSPVEALTYLLRMGRGVLVTGSGPFLRLLGFTCSCSNVREKHGFLLDPASSREQLEGRKEGT